MTRVDKNTPKDAFIWQLICEDGWKPRVGTSIIDPPNPKLSRPIRRMGFCEHARREPKDLRVN